MKSICPFVWGGKFCVSLLNVEWRKVNFYSTWSVQLYNFSFPSPCAQCVYLRSSFRSVRADTVHKARTYVRSSCVHKAFILHSPFVQCSFVVQSDNTIFRLIKIHICSIFFLITEETQSKDNRLISFILRSYIVYILFTVRLSFTLRSRLRSLCLLRSYTVYKRSPNSIQRALTVHSQFKLESRTFQRLWLGYWVFNRCTVVCNHL